MKKVLLLVVVLAILAGGAYYYVSNYGNPFSNPASKHKEFKEMNVTQKMKVLPDYSKKYISGADVDEFMELAKKDAKAKGLKIFVIAGGNWCKWCKLLDRFLMAKPDVANALYNNYIVVRAHYKGNGDGVDKDFFEKYPRVRATPHFFILDDNAKLVKDQGSALFEQGYGYNSKKLIEFLTQNK